MKQSTNKTTPSFRGILFLTISREVFPESSFHSHGLVPPQALLEPLAQDLTEGDGRQGMGPCRHRIPVTGIFTSTMNIALDWKEHILCRENLVFPFNVTDEETEE